jgi:peptide/nickel transport system substrate-binding protein
LAPFPQLTLTLDFVPAGDGYRRTAETVARSLRAIGIDVTVRAQDFAAYTRRVYSDRDFQLTIGRINNMFDPSVGVQRAYWSKNFKPGVPFSNGAHYANAEVDRLLEEAAVENDPVRRAQLFNRFQHLVVEDLPDIALLAPKQITIANHRVAGHTIGACGPAESLAAVSLTS